MVPAVPDLPPAAGRPARRAPAPPRGRPVLRPLPARRADGGGRRLPRGAARGRGPCSAAWPRRAGSAMGPWYILMDEFLVSGETIVRNLQLGLERAAALRRRHGGRLPARHVRPRRPDAPAPAPGRASSTPSCGGACPSAVDRTAFWWTAPDGSTRAGRVPARRLRQRRRRCPTTPRRSCARIARLRAPSWATLLGDAPLLWMNGTDHQLPQPWLGRVVAEANDLQDDYQLAVTSLAEHLGRGADRRACPTWTGELRSGARANLLMGVASNRVDVKQAAAAGRAGPRAAGRAAVAPCSCRPTRWPGAAPRRGVAARSSATPPTTRSAPARLDEVVRRRAPPLRRGPPDRRRPRRPRRSRPSPRRCATRARRRQPVGPAPRRARRARRCPATGPVGDGAQVLQARGPAVRPT